MSPGKGRPKKVRYIQKMPKIIQFSPRGKPGRPEEIELSLDEFEAVKLADYQEFSQEEGAIAMRVSRASFGRILRLGRKKLADAIVNGKIIKIRMGSTQIGVRKTDFTNETLREELEKFKEQARTAARGGVEPAEQAGWSDRTDVLVTKEPATAKSAV